MDLRPLLGPAGADAVGDLEEERVSRASEWAKQRRTAERFIREETVPRFRVPEFSIAFQVDVDGDLAVVKGAERLFYIRLSGRLHSLNISLAFFPRVELSSAPEPEP